MSIRNIILHFKVNKEIENYKWVNLPTEEQEKIMLLEDDRYIREDDSIGYQMEDHNNELKDEWKKSCREQFKEWKNNWVGDKAIMGVMRDKIKELEYDILHSRSKINNLYKELHNEKYNEFEKYFLKNMIEKAENEKIGLEKKKRNFGIKLDIIKGKRIENYAELDIEGAKQYPIGDLMEGEPKFRSSGREFYICPIDSHHDKTASFCWFKKDNKGHCFGCGWHGDAIDLYQEINNCDFITAIKSLT